MSTSEHSSPQGPNGPDKEFLDEFQKVIMSYAQAVEAGKTEEAEQAAMTALMVAGIEAEKNPTPDLLLSQEATECEQAGNWAGAEAAYLKLLKLQEQTGNFGLVVKPSMDLSRLYRHLGAEGKASVSAGAATAAARKTEISTLLAMALENELRTALARRDVSAALALAAEAVSVIEPGKIADPARARALVSHAECLVAAGDLDSAENRLQMAWNILESHSVKTFLLGPAAALSKWWEVKAAVCLKQGSPAEAAAALTRAIEFCRQGLARAIDGPSPFARVRLADLLERLAAVLSETGKHESAGLALAEAAAVRAEIHLRPRQD